MKEHANYSYYQELLKKREPCKGSYADFITACNNIKSVRLSKRSQGATNSAISDYGYVGYIGGSRVYSSGYR